MKTWEGFTNKIDLFFEHMQDQLPVFQGNVNSRVEFQEKIVKISSTKPAMKKSKNCQEGNKNLLTK